MNISPVAANQTTLRFGEKSGIGPGGGSLARTMEQLAKQQRVVAAARNIADALPVSAEDKGIFVRFMEVLAERNRF